jgi:cytochrome P450
VSILELKAKVKSHLLTKICTSVAGSDTTAGGIRATLLYIITNPRVYQSLVTEILNAQLSSPVRDSEAKQLPYLQAVIREGLRMHPPVAALMSKVVPAGGDNFDGRFVPAGTKISYSAWGVYRNKKVWGEDANTFRPERWLHGSPEKIKELKEIWEFIFGGGRYKCLGQNVALMEINKVIVEVSLSPNDILYSGTR